MLLLDEPTNYLDAESVAWLEHHLRDYKGNYSSWLEQKQERIRLEEKSESQRQKTLSRELKWIRMGAKARQAKGQDRVTVYEKLLGQEAEARRRFFYSHISSSLASIY